MLIENGIIVTGGESFVGYLVIEGEVITKIGRGDAPLEYKNGEVVNARGGYIMAGAIDDQVHFREPGMTEKADIESESMAAIAGGVTSFMDMPNNKPAATTIELLEAKYSRAAEVSMANYSFYLGATNDNIDQICKLNKESVCGVKVFMGSSTGNMLVDRREALEAIFSKSEVLVATHCEDEDIVSANLKAAFAEFGDNIPMELHPKIRSAEACYKSSSFAVDLAKRFGTRLHVLHLTTGREMELFSEGSVGGKRITSEVCAHHLWFSEADYDTYGGKIKCNPAIKSVEDRNALRDALRSGRLDVVATDHAPHLLSEKEQPYTKCPSGLPLIQHSLVMMLEMFDVKDVTRWMSENVAQCFGVVRRGLLKEGYFADVVVVEKQNWTVSRDSVLYKCGWSPMEGCEFKHKVVCTIVNGNVVFKDGNFNKNARGRRLEFER